MPLYTVKYLVKGFGTAIDKVEADSEAEAIEKATRPTKDKFGEDAVLTVFSAMTEQGNAEYLRNLVEDEFTPAGEDDRYE